jgi:two-component system, cell cycle sensor histidine kinase and response regulator CckA
MKYVDMIETASRHATALAERLLSFSRRSDREFGKVCVNTLVKNTLDLLHGSMKANIRLKTNCSNGVPDILGDKTQLEQLIMNIVINARDAITESGTITVETSYKKLDDKFCREHLGAQPGENAVITISDTGTGMSEEVRKRIFEPFFTTKKDGKGTGLGLSIAYSVIRSHKGTIDVKSEVGKGTVFTIYLPVLIEKQESAMEVKKQSGGTKTVLVIEDEDYSRIQAETALAKLGYNVILASAADEAVSMIEQSMDEVNLAIIGTFAGNNNPERMLRELHRVNPNMRAVFSSRSVPVRKSAGGKHSAVKYVGKPYNFDELSRTIHEIFK